MQIKQTLQLAADLRAVSLLESLVEVGTYITRHFTILRAVTWAKLDLLGLLECFRPAKGSFYNLARPDQEYFPGFL